MAESNFTVTKINELPAPKLTLKASRIIKATASIVGSIE